MRNAVVNRLFELARSDARLMLITADLGFGVLTDYAEKYPNQFLNVGVAEQNMTALATGMALEGHVVFTYSIANFPTLRCLEQVRNDVCYHDVPVKIVAIGGGFSYGSLGMSHHATEDLAILRSLPNMVVTAPSDPWQAAHIVDALIEHPGPAYLRVDKSQAGLPVLSREEFEFGRARKICEGSDVTLISTGGILVEAIKATQALQEDGITARVLDMHAIKPLDCDAITEAVNETGGLITIEEHNVIGGLGGAIAEYCLEAGLKPGFFQRVGLHDTYSSTVGSQEYLRNVYRMDAQAIAATSKSQVRANGPDGG
jgi:transketolase